ncbi:acyl-CoA dehydrogenase/oxidase [Zychaea mexicana]|uniref:acyl-CoA dehydrogenase/oxidase n=1 Tax=Zychaea mexicana TaxID=64656 RepID=UPI0022FE6479|nr:acyl-CoA dehydrogenase/oxidase [Zychaea mexicana]KAI9493173.1 acyl-CoA dehydrogenase/oxidase [Zychaea mexicana]
MSLQAPKDMAAERAAAGFDIEALKHHWHGGVHQYQLLERAYKLIKSDPELVVQPPRNFMELTKDESREFTMGQIYRTVKLLQDPVIRSQGPEFTEAIFQALVSYSESYSMRIGVHRALFRNVLLMLGSDEQRDAWLDAVDNYRIFGCFAMTELGHSSALRDIETTATFDPNTDEFVINSPTITATKWWIGMAGKTATHTMVIAQTYIGGQHHGHNWFIVQLRDTASGALQPNVIAGDIGHKVGRPGLDNGWIQFHNVRIPRSQMLNRWVDLDRQGNYTPAPSPVVMYATLIPERIMIVMNSMLMVSHALTIATRYSVVRRQGNQNQQIMDYLSHYGKFVPAISFIYMVRSASSTLDEQFKILTAGGDMDPEVYMYHMGDMHAISACLKGITGWYGSDVLETCRRACGGHAYSAYNNIGQIINDWGVLTTGGGDNVVLLQQTARILLHQLTQKLDHDQYPQLKFKSSTHYFIRAKEYLAKPSWNVTDVSACLSDLTLVEEALFTILVKRLNSIREELKAGATQNDLLLDSVRVAEMHAAAFLYSDAVEKYGKPDPALEPSVAQIMRRMTAVWGLHTLHTYSDQGFKEGFLNPQQVKQIEKLYLTTSKGMRKQVVGLTDAWGYPDFVLKAPIAKYDGDIYEPYFETLLMSKNSVDVPSYHGRYIKPLTDN